MVAVDFVLMIFDDRRRVRWLGLLANFVLLASAIATIVAPWVGDRSYNGLGVFQLVGIGLATIALIACWASFQQALVNDAYWIGLMAIVAFLVDVFRKGINHDLPGLHIGLVWFVIAASALAVWLHLKSAGYYDSSTSRRSLRFRRFARALRAAMVAFTIAAFATYGIEVWATVVIADAVTWVLLCALFIAAHSQEAGTVTASPTTTST